MSTRWREVGREVGRGAWRGVEREVDGTRTWWAEYGDPGAPVLLALHGFRGTHEGLAGIARRVRGRRVVVPDLPGFGHSAPFTDRAHDVAGYARWADALLTDLGGGGDPDGRPAVLGHSFGSVVATAVVAPRSADVHALVLLAPLAVAVAGSAGLPGAADRVLAGAYGVVTALGEGAGAAVLRSRAAADLATVTLVCGRDPALRAHVRAEHRRHFGRFADLDVLRQAFHAARTEHVGAHLDGVETPVLVVAGAEDRVVPTAAQHALVARRPAARLVVLPGTGHLLHYEAPRAVAGAIDDVLGAAR